MKEAERRQTQVTNRRILRCGARPFGARTLVGVPPRLWGGIALMFIMAIDAIWLLAWQPRPLSAVLLNIGLLFFSIAAIAQFSPSYWAQKQQQIVHDTQSLGPLVEALRQSQNALQGQQAAEQIVQKIIQQYDQLKQGTRVFEQFSGSPAGAQRALIDRLTAARATIENLRALLGNVRVQATNVGRFFSSKQRPILFA
jgi:hypothetical protein